MVVMVWRGVRATLLDTKQVYEQPDVHDPCDKLDPRAPRAPLVTMWSSHACYFIH